MAITSYSELKTAIAAWQNKTSLAAYLADFVTLAEAKINRRLRVSGMETSMAETAIAADVIARPANMLAIKTMWATGSNQRTLEQKTLEYILRMPSLSSQPQFYAWDGANIRFYPSAGSVGAVYYAKIPALSDAAPSNWLIAESPDLYLWAGIEQAAIYLKDDAAQQKYAAMADGLIEELNSRSGANQISGGPLRARAR